MILRIIVISSIRLRFIFERASYEGPLNSPLSQAIIIELVFLYRWRRIQFCELHGVEDHMVISIVFILILRKSVEALDDVGAQGLPLDLRVLVGLQRHQVGPVQVAIRCFELFL